ncbi:integrase [Gloeomargarita lithophora Alchichica-D10]|uniref:Integrase n=1 Tax=Gloeomargarita lithophora Alchichica-D10 TaxID=1188229 RepID=A0A1J0AAR7_9CYAN|nr:tyrosine-type recombinase/integrase [Gloeomargarita lithophora]APB33005.1 integrase [Gloeomargarita lithophora Alchichica-D10]
MTISLAPITADPSLKGQTHPVLIYLARLSPGSRRTLYEALELLARWSSQSQLGALEFPWWELRYPHTAALRSRLAAHYAPATVNKQLAALRGVLRECWRLGLLTAEDYHRTIDIPTVKGQRLLRGRVLSENEVSILLAICQQENSPAGCRDATLLGLLAGSGLRRAEVVALQLQDYEPAENRLRIRSGKGNKDRLVYVAPGADVWLARWLALRGAGVGALLCPVNRWGQVVVRALTEQAVLHILSKRGQQAGIAAFSPHDLRRTFISNLLDAGVDIATVQKLAGHANVQTTIRYDRRDERAKQAAIALLQIRT